MVCWFHRSKARTNTETVTMRQYVCIRWSDSCIRESSQKQRTTIDSSNSLSYFYCLHAFYCQLYCARGICATFSSSYSTIYIIIIIFTIAWNIATFHRMLFCWVCLCLCIYACVCVSGLHFFHTFLAIDFMYKRRFVLDVLLFSFGLLQSCCCCISISFFYLLLSLSEARAEH